MDQPDRSRRGVQATLRGGMMILIALTLMAIGSILMISVLGALTAQEACAEDGCDPELICSADEDCAPCVCKRGGPVGRCVPKEVAWATPSG